MNFVPAVNYHFCLALPAAFTQPGASLLANPWTRGSSHINYETPLSIINGTAIAWANKADKALKSNYCHFSKDAVDVYWSSWVVHIDSPLKVNVIDLLLEQKIFLSCSILSGPIP